MKDAVTVAFFHQVTLDKTTIRNPLYQRFHEDQGWIDQGQSATVGMMNNKTIYEPPYHQQKNVCIVDFFRQMMIKTF